MRTKRSLVLTVFYSGQPAPVLNNYRQNVQGEGLFNAPDLMLKDLRVDDTGCPTSLLMQVRVFNNGALGVLSGIPVSFYAEGSPRTLLGTARTQGKLLPGQSEIVSFTYAIPAQQTWPIKLVVVADDDGTGHSGVSECREDNNKAGPLTLVCLTIG